MKSFYYETCIWSFLSLYGLNISPKWNVFNFQSMDYVGKFKRFFLSWTFVVRFVEFGYGNNSKWGFDRNVYSISCFMLGNVGGLLYMVVYARMVYADTMKNKPKMQTYSQFNDLKFAEIIFQNQNNLIFLIDEWIHTVLTQKTLIQFIFWKFSSWTIRNDEVSYVFLR